MAAEFGKASDTYDATGKLHRKVYPPRIMKDWPFGLKGDALGKPCVPTYLIYKKATRKLLYWGFAAQRYLDTSTPKIPPDEVYVVEHIKLLLPDPDKAIQTTPANVRYKRKREELYQNLQMKPFEVFQDLLDVSFNAVVYSALGNFGSFSSYKVELALAFPSGWAEDVHRQVAETAAS